MSKKELQRRRSERGAGPDGVTELGTKGVVESRRRAPKESWSHGVVEEGFTIGGRGQ